MVRHNIRRRRRYCGRASRQRDAFFEWSVCLCAAIVLAAACIGMIQQRLRPVFQQVAAAYIRQDVQELISQVISEEILQHCGYGDLIHLERDKEGRVSVMTTDMVQVNRLRQDVVTKTGNLLGEQSAREFAIPLGSLTNIAAFSNKGLKIPVEVELNGVVQVELEHEFTDAGINQSRHQIILKLEIPLTVVLSGKAWEETVSSNILVGETVIVGAVPQTYLQFTQEKGVAP